MGRLMCRLPSGHQGCELNPFQRTGKLRPDTGWFCLRSAPKREPALKIQLHRRGILALCPNEVYWVKPTTREKREHPHRRWVPRDRPLFPRLVFARVQELADWDKIRAAPFIVGALMMNGRFYRLSDSDVTMLYNVDGLQTPPPADPKAIRSGQKAKISVGAFAGHPCEVQAIAGKRAKVLMMLLGSMKVIEVPVANLEAA